MYTILKFIFNVLSTTCPISLGSFGPAFALGAGMGRTYGYILKRVGNYIGLELVKCKFLLFLKSL